MTTAIKPNSKPTIGLASKLVNSILAIGPLASLAKHQARKMMIERAEGMGVPWRKIVAELQAEDLDTELVQVQNSNLKYPKYYLTSFHAYESGNLSWEAATEVEVAAYAVHSRIWKGANAQGDAMLRQSYHDVLNQQIAIQPDQIHNILDVGCSVGMSTFALAQAYPEAKITGLDLSPYFLAIANYQTRHKHPEWRDRFTWQHAAAEATGLADNSFDLASIFLVYHELPKTAAREILKEMHRVVRPGGYLTIMDMNPNSEIYAKMPPYILTLLKSTEPYLDQYFSLDMAHEFEAAGFERPTITCNSPRHRTIVARSLKQ
ncbi:Methyltransferase type 11 [Thalassoporum mexicanum PCC 7367]|uniref:class I SAM-dependent methyltransferase n=1 Tax=Thalassoporum mexicanum TaxID=3457544 RepID=UPI00029FD192|nr:class I SAM-dependent methyltransferase [Pseudanabaena sp. PCC 7367]AFY71514.1 Methyltransferase type 11 [Pseudanabaena sp. PCC 7367]